MAVNLSPVAGAAAQFFDNSGNVLTGGKLYTYSAGTTTPAVTYTTNSGITAHANPIVLNAAGRVPDSGEIWLTDSLLYKFVLKDTNDVLIATWDNINGINSNFVAYSTQNETQTATQGQTVFTLTSIQYQPATSNLAVYVNGSKQILTLNYIETSSTVVTFIDGLNVGDVVQFTTASAVATNVVDAANVSYDEGDTGAVLRNVQQKLQEFVSVKDFGAIGNGVANDTDAINNAIATGKAVDFGGDENTYLIYSSITIGANQTVFGSGAKILSAINDTFFVLSDYSVVTGLKFAGNGSGSAQNAISIDDVYWTHVSSCYFASLGGAAYYVTNTVDIHQGNQFIGNRIENCAIGINLATRGEYANITGCNISACGTGIRIIGGNACVNACVISNSVNYGIYVGNGSNDAHGLINGCLINHSATYSFKFDAPSVNDFRVMNCEVYYGDVWLVASNKINFDSCTFGSIANFYFEGSIDTLFDSCYFQTLPTFNNDFNGSASKTHYVNSTYPNAITFSAPALINGGYIEVNLTANQDFSSSSTAQTVIFNNILYNSVTNCVEYTYESFYNSTTGVFDVRQLKSPNAGYFCDANININIGGSGFTNFAAVDVYLYNVALNRYEGIFTPQTSVNADGGTNWKMYNFSGTVLTSAYKVVVLNQSGSTVTLYRSGGGVGSITIPALATFAGF